MSNPTRVNAGVPTGGQFAAGVHGESELSLGAPPAPAAYDFEAAGIAIVDAQKAAGRAHARQNERVAGHLARIVRQHYPNAAYISMSFPNQDGEWSDYPNLMTMDVIYDADRNELAEAADIDSPKEIQEATWNWQLDANGGAPEYAWGQDPDAPGEGPVLDIDRVLALPDPRSGTAADLATQIEADREARAQALDQAWTAAEDSNDAEDMIDAYYELKETNLEQDREDLNRLLAAFAAVQPAGPK